LGARLPVWTLPTIIEVHNGTLIPRRIALSTAGGALPSATDAATPTPPSRPDFSLQSVSDGLIRAINNASSGLSAALSNATSTPGAPSTQADLDRILRSASGGGSSGYRSTSRTSWSSSRSSWSSGSSRSSWSSHSSRSSSFGGSHRSSSSSHSGGGGRRGFR